MSNVSDESRVDVTAEVIPPPRKSRAMRVLGILSAAAVLVVGGLFLYYMISLHRAESHLAEVKAGLSFKLVPAKDLPTLWGPAPAEDDNAAPLYEQAITLANRSFVWSEDSIRWEYDLLLERVSEDDSLTSEEADRETAALKQSLEKALLLSKEYKLLLVVWGLADAEDIAEYDDDAGEEVVPEIPPRDPVRVQAFLDSIAEVRRLRDQAVTRSGYRGNEDWSGYMAVSVASLNGMQALARLTSLEVTVAAEQGRWDEAYGHLFQILAMVDHVDQQPTISGVCMTMRMRTEVCETMAGLFLKSLPSEPLRKKIEERLTLDARAQFRRAIISECVGINGIFEDFLVGRDPRTNSLAPKSPVEPSFRPTMRLKTSLLEGQAAYLEFMDACVRLSAPPDDPSVVAECERIVDAFEPSVERIGGVGGKLAGGMARAFSRERVTCDRAGALARMTCLGMRLAEWRQTRHEFPATLGELGETGRVPSDPFSKKPFHYRREGAGFVLWSVGPDGDDDGGMTEGDGDGDVVFCVPPRPR